MTGLEIAGDEATVHRHLGVTTNQAFDGVSVDWIDPCDSETGIIAAAFETALGTVRID